MTREKIFHIVVSWVVIAMSTVCGCTIPEGEVEDESEGKAHILTRAVTGTDNEKDAGPDIIKDGGVDECDPNIMTPVVTTLEGILNGEMDKELYMLRELCLRRKKEINYKEEDESDAGSSMELDSWSSGGSPISPGFQKAYRYLGNSADDNDPNGWFDQLQGITNDDTYWYFSKNQAEGNNSRIFKVAYSQNLNTSFTVADYWSGRISDCNHFGDIDYYNGLIVVSIEGCSDDHARFAFFKASTLDLLAYVEDEHNVLNHHKAPWVAVREGRLFSSKGETDVEVIHEWEVRWNLIPSNPPAEEIDYDDFVISHDTHGLYDIYYSDENWDDDELHEVQGGDFSSDGTIFYASVGLCEPEYAPCTCSPRKIMAFEYNSGDWPMINWSSYTDEPFKFAVDTSGNGCDEETEGITYYDTNVLSSYGTSKRGEVIAELVNVDVGDDNAWIKHYTSIIDVNPEDGVNYALYNRWNGHGAWGGSILELEGGTYEESLDMSYIDFCPVKMVSTGTAIIHP